MVIQTELVCRREQVRSENVRVAALHAPAQSTEGPAAHRSPRLPAGGFWVPSMCLY